jgi:hypothetical protein
MAHHPHPHPVLRAVAEALAYVAFLFAVWLTMWGLSPS